MEHPKQVAAIHDSIINGQLRQATTQIDDYGLYYFFADYRDFLDGLYTEAASVLDYFSRAVIFYHRIKNR